MAIGVTLAMPWSITYAVGGITFASAGVLSKRRTEEAIGNVTAATVRRAAVVRGIFAFRNIGGPPSGARDQGSVTDDNLPDSGRSRLYDGLCVRCPAVGMLRGGSPRPPSPVSCEVLATLLTLSSCRAAADFALRLPPTPAWATSRLQVPNPSKFPFPVRAIAVQASGSWTPSGGPS